MTEQVTESGKADEAPKFPDEMAEMSFNMLKGLIDQRNAKVGTINAVKGDRQTLSEQIEAQSDKPEIVQAREAAAKAKEIWDEAVLSLHKVVAPEVDRLLADAESSVKQTEEEVKELDAKIKPGSNYFRKMYGESLSKFLPALARLKGFTTKGAGSTGRRVRGYSVDVTVDGETRGFDNLASAAKYLVLDTSVLQEAFFSAAGNPEKLKDAPDRVDFTVEFTETYDDDTTEQKTATLVATRDAEEAKESDDTEAAETESGSED